MRGFEKSSSETLPMQHHHDDFDETFVSVPEHEPMLSARRKRAFSLTTGGDTRVSKINAGLFLVLLLSIVYTLFGAPSRTTTMANGHEEEAITALPEIHYLLPATSANDKFCTGLSSALVNDAEPIILNWGGSLKAPAIFMDKIYKTYDYMVQYTKPNDVVILLDSFDTLLQRSINDVVRDFVRSKAMILFGAEKGCCCRAETKERPFCSGAPESPLPADLYGEKQDRYATTSARIAPNVRPKFLNSGNVVGYAAPMIRLYADMIAFMQHDEYGKTFVNDQSVFVDFYWRNMHNMTLDYESKVSKPVWSSDQDFVLAPRLHGQSEHPVDHSLPSGYLLGHSTPWLMFDLVNKAWPGFLHFNGEGKAVMKDFFHQQWWAGHAPVAESVRTRVYEFLRRQTIPHEHKNGKRVSFNDLCAANLDFTEHGMEWK